MDGVPGITNDALTMPCTIFAVSDGVTRKEWISDLTRPKHQVVFLSTLECLHGNAVETVKVRPGLPVSCYSLDELTSAPGGQ